LNGLLLALNLQSSARSQSAAFCLFLISISINTARMSAMVKPTASQPRNPHKQSLFNPLDSQLPLLTADSPVTDYLPWLQYAQEELDRSGINSDVKLMPHPLSFKIEQNRRRWERKELEHIYI
jgi:hypothetical protein